MFWAWWFLLVLVFVHNEFGLDIISSVSLTIASILTISGIYQLITYMTCKVQSTFKSDLMESLDNLEGAENLYTSYEYEDIGKNRTLLEMSTSPPCFEVLIELLVKYLNDIRNVYKARKRLGRLSRIV